MKLCVWTFLGTIRWTRQTNVGWCNFNIVSRIILHLGLKWCKQKVTKEWWTSAPKYQLSAIIYMQNLLNELKVKMKVCLKWILRIWNISLQKIDESWQDQCKRVSWLFWKCFIASFIIQTTASHSTTEPLASTIAFVKDIPYILATF